MGGLGFFYAYTIVIISKMGKVVCKSRRGGGGAVCDCGRGGGNGVGCNLVNTLYI